MKTVTSKDGTTIAYDQTGNGPPLVLVDGALNSRVFGLNGPLAAILADRFTVVTLQNATRALAQALPGASHHTLPGQTHIVKPKPLAPVLAEFFSAPGNRSARGGTAQ